MIFLFLYCYSSQENCVQLPPTSLISLSTPQRAWGQSTCYVSGCSPKGHHLVWSLVCPLNFTFTSPISIEFWHLTSALINAQSNLIIPRRGTNLNLKTWLSREPTSLHRCITIMVKNNCSCLSDFRLVSLQGLLVFCFSLSRSLYSSQDIS